MKRFGIFLIAMLLGSVVSYADNEMFQYNNVWYLTLSRASRTCAFVGEVSLEGTVHVPSVAIYENDPNNDNKNTAFTVVQAGGWGMMTGQMTTLVLPETVTRISNVSSSIERIVLPSSVKYIDSNAFNGCSELQEINLEDTQIVTLEPSVFSGCRALRSLVLPPTLTSINQQNFIVSSSLAGSWKYGCTVDLSLTKVTELPNKVFWKEKLSNIILPSSLKKIGGQAFYMNNITEIGIPEGVVEIGDSAFMGCKSLTHIKIPDNVAGINNCMFRGCISLSNIDLPSALSSIGDYAFYETALEKIIFPEALRSIGARAFENCKKLTSLDIPDGCSEIGQSAFEATFVSQVHLPLTLKEVSEGLFYGNTALSAIDIPPLVTRIGRGAFYWNPLKTIVIPASVISIEENAFYGNGNAWNVSIRFLDGDAPLSIHDMGICNMNDVVELYLGRQLDEEYVGFGRWVNNSLKKVTIGSGVKSMAADFFRNCNDIEEVHCNDINRWAMIDFGNAAANPLSRFNPKFYEKNSRVSSSIELSGNIDRIGKYAFYGLKCLNSVIMGGSINEIGEYAFKKCEKIHTIVVDNPIPPEVAENTFEDYKAELIVPAGSLGVYKDHPVWKKFYSIINPTTIYTNYTIGVLIYRLNEDGKTCTVVGCTDSAAGEVVIPETVTINGIDYTVTGIGIKAFYSNTAIDAIYIPRTVTKVGSLAFADSDVYYMYLDALTPPEICADSFSNYQKRLYVPHMSISQYRSHDVWSNFYLYAGIGDVSADGDGVAVRVEDGRIVVDGLPDGAVVEVYDVAGRQVHRGTGDIPRLTHGVYMVRVGIRVAKVRV